MKLKLKDIAASLTLLGLLSSGAYAQNANSPAGWLAYGDVAAAGSQITLTTSFKDGDGDEAYNLSGNSAIDVLFGDMATKAGVDITAFDIGGEFAVEGALMTRSFDAMAGQTISFDWSFSTHETTYLDNAFVVINGSLLSLATTANPGSALQTYSYTISQGGPVALSIGIVDTESAFGVSLLTVSNVQLANVAPVPEPATNALMLGGLGVLGFFAKRRRDAARRSH